MAKAKAKKRKLPLSKTPTDNTSSKPQAGRNVIRRFHVLIKTQARLQSKPSLNSSEVKELRKVDEEIGELGGLEWYQRMSAIGQGSDRGGGSEKILIGWLKDMKMHEARAEKLKSVILSRYKLS
jgi:25S rRNA (adenine2142-N1)-methyltransferase